MLTFFRSMLMVAAVSPALSQEQIPFDAVSLQAYGIIREAHDRATFPKDMPLAGDPYDWVTGEAIRGKDQSRVLQGDWDPRVVTPTRIKPTEVIRETKTAQAAEDPPAPIMVKPATDICRGRGKRYYRGNFWRCRR